MGLAALLAGGPSSGVFAAKAAASSEALTASHLALAVRAEALSAGELGPLTLPELPSDLQALTSRLFFRDGRANRELVPQSGRAAIHDGSWEAAWGFPEDLEVNARLAARSGHLSLLLTFHNRGAAQRWIETGVNLELATREDWHFWDGLERFAGRNRFSHKRDTLPGVFPAAAVYTPQAGILVGIEPLQLLSYLRSSASSEDGENIHFEYATRIVVDPAATEQVEFVFAAFEGTYGHLGALQRYYDEFPAAFLPRPETDPRVTLSGAQYTAWTANDPELCRRSYSGWEWAYAPFRRTGDIYGHREFWDYTPARPFGSFRAYSFEQFHQWRKEAFLRGVNCNVAMLFYVPAGIWVEQQLADERYSTARVRETGVTTAMNRPWVTGHDNEYRVFPYGNAYAETIRADMKRVAEELNLQGFAFDVANGGIRVHARYTEGVAGAPGRAWDEEGVFVDEGVAIALLMDYARSLEKDGRPLAVVSNPSASGVYMTIFRSDAAMFEAPPWREHGLPPEPLRARLGHKTLVWWEGWELDSTLNMEREAAAVHEAFLGMVDYVILKSLALGALPAAGYVRGVPPLGRALPMLAELVQAGWQPVPAVTGAPEGIWLSRYGRGGGSYIAAGNATLAPFEGALLVDNTYLGEANYLFTHFSGEPLRNTVAGRTTAVFVTIPSRQPFVGRAALAVAPLADTPIGATVSREENLASITTRVVFELAEPALLSFAIEPPGGYSLAKVEKNGQAVAVQAAGGAATFAAEVADGDVLEIHYRSDTYRVSRSDLLAFPFFSELSQPPAVIMLPADPSEGALYGAYRLQKFFLDYSTAWRSDCSGVVAAGGVPLGSGFLQVPRVLVGDGPASYRMFTFSGGFFDPSVREADAPGGDQHRVILADDWEGDGGVVELRDGGRTLFIGASDPDRLRSLVIDVLHQLDAKYAYFGRLVTPLQRVAPACR